MAEKAAEILSSLKIPKQYGKVVITLENVLLPEERLASTPSSLDGLDPETEMDLRILGSELIQTAGILLRLPQVAMATGQVLFHRFYHSKSFVRQPMEVTAMGCLCCASKVEEAPRRIRDVISVFEHIKQVRGGKPLTPVLLDQGYISLKNQVIKAERRVLKELGFCVHVKHPHKIVVMYLQILGFEKNKRLVQLSWNYMNDSLRTDVFVRYSPETIACACIYLSARKLSIVLPKKPAWYLLFGSVEKDLKDICIRILKLYTRARPNADELDRIVAQLEQAYQESRQRSKGPGHIEGGVATPVKSEIHSTFSPNATGLVTAPIENKAQSADSAGSTPSVMKGDEKNHVSVTAIKTSKTADVPSRSVSRSASPIDKHDKDRRHKSRHHRHHHHSRKTTKRSRSRSRSPRSRSIEKRTTSSRTDRGGGGDHRDNKDRDRRKRDSASDKYDSRDRDRDNKDRDHKRRQDKNKERDRRRDRSLSRDRRR